MKKIFLLPALCAIIFLFTKCEKQADYYYAEYLSNAEQALPSKVDSLQILPGKHKAKLKFKVGPDRRVTKFKISYNTSLSTLLITSFTDIEEEDYGHYKEVEIGDLPEAVMYVNIIAFNAKGDSSNVSQAVANIYGDTYHNLLGNRIFQGTSTVKDSKGNNIKDANGNDLKQLGFLGEASAPQDSTLFYPLQRTVITYPTRSGGTNTIEMLPQRKFVTVPNLAPSGIIKHYSVYKPVENAIDVFNTTEVNVTY